MLMSFFFKNVHMFSDALTSVYAQITWEFGNQELKTVQELLYVFLLVYTYFLRLILICLLLSVKWPGRWGLENGGPIGITFTDGEQAGWPDHAERRGQGYLGLVPDPHQAAMLFPLEMSPSQIPPLCSHHISWVLAARACLTSLLRKFY